MIELHPVILKKDGESEFVVLSYDEFIEIQRVLDDVQDLMDLREAKKAEGNAPGISLEEMRRELGL
jgi:hypothetical protein